MIKRKLKNFILMRIAYHGDICSDKWELQEIFIESLGLEKLEKFFDSDFTSFIKYYNLDGLYKIFKICIEELIIAEKIKVLYPQFPEECEYDHYTINWDVVKKVDCLSCIHSYGFKPMIYCGKLGGYEYYKTDCWDESTSREVCNLYKKVNTVSPKDARRFQIDNFNKKLNKIIKEEK